MGTLIPLAAAFAGMIDLAAERLGGKALAASDEFFAEKENLLKPGRGVFIEDKYTERGKWMDGWETRRKRTAGHDWCVIKLGCRGMIRGVDIDTNHFLGNHPAFASVEACRLDDDAFNTALTSGKAEWHEILPRSPLNPGAQNLFAILSDMKWTHVRLNIFPDGGVARFRAYGVVAPNWKQLETEPMLDLGAVEHGGLAVACSDMFFSSMNNLIMPGRAAHMGDGWETRRRRGPGHDWVIIRLGRTGRLKKVEIDTSHFKGNYPDQCSLDVCHAPDVSVDSLSWSNFTWHELLPKTKMQADTQHIFEKELKDAGPVSHVRLNIYPDGGVSRLRLWGSLG
jgi:allantoicase